MQTNIQPSYYPFALLLNSRRHTGEGLFFTEHDSDEKGDDDDDDDNGHHHHLFDDGNNGCSLVVIKEKRGCRT